jgi:hypothetical protein
LRKQIPAAYILNLEDILHFEGKRGPDSTRLKKGGNEPPWHFYEPGAKNDEFTAEVENHFSGLVESLKSNNSERANFEASWLAHALVDGLTPAHHFPYREALEDLYGKDIMERETVRSHFVVKGDSYKETMKKSIKLVGPKGLLTTHSTFEAGAAMIIMPLTLTNIKVTKEELGSISRETLLACMDLHAQQIAEYKMYQRFYKAGWTPKLVRDVRLHLAPAMVKVVALAWYAAYKEAGLVE